MRIAITGATGLLGRNLLFEIIKQNFRKLDDLEIFVFGRSHPGVTLRDRLKYILTTDGIYYVLGAEPQDPEGFWLKVQTALRPVVFDLTQDDLGISVDDFAKLKGRPIDIFFHVAALTDFRDTAEVRDRLQKINVEGTKKVLKLLDNLDITVKQIAYVGSAYSCGDAHGLVEPDYINLGARFRNPYERSKLEAEIYFRDFVSQKGWPYKVFRPSTIAGRLIEQPIGAVSKFDVFYGWAGFFLREKVKKIQDWAKVFDIPMKMPIRLESHPNSGLDIIPADYAAKILYGACMNGAEQRNFYLAMGEEFSHRLYTKMILENMNIYGFSYVEREPKDQNQLEKFHYKTVGRIFAPYTTAEPTLFNMENVDAIIAKNGINRPQVNTVNFKKLIDYAQSKYYGIKPRE